MEVIEFDIRTFRKLLLVGIAMLVAVAFFCCVIPVAADYFSGQVDNHYLSLSSSATTASHPLIGSATGSTYLSLGTVINPSEPDIEPDADEPEEGTTDILPGGTPGDWFVEPDVGVGGSLLTNPFRPIVTFVSDNTTLTELQVWRWFGIIVVLFATVSTAVLVPKHLGIACFAGGAATVAMVLMTIWPVWALAFLVIYAFGGFVSERAPSL